MELFIGTISLKLEVVSKMLRLSVLLLCLGLSPTFIQAACRSYQWACSNCGMSCCSGGAGCTTVTTEFQPDPSLRCRLTFDYCCGGHPYRYVSTTTQGIDCDGMYKVTTDYLCCKIGL